MASLDDITNLSLVELSRHLQDGSITSRMATEASLAAIAEANPIINAFLTIDAEAALAAADVADAEMRAGRRRGTLHGVPLAHKDMFYRKGGLSTGGSKILASIPADRTATVLEKLDDAGAITLGLLNMAEFAAGPTGQNDHYGACRNPWNPAHISGGSSSGSGAAVAARLAYGSIGSDTGGSIRLPAGLCGVTGVKTTYGRVSRYGAMPRCWSLDVFGPLARDAADCAVLLEAIAGRDLRDSSTLDVAVPHYSAQFPADLSGVTIGVPDNHFYPDLDSSVRPAHEATLEILKDLGATVRFLPMPDPDPIYKLTNLVNKAEAAALHSRWLTERHADYALSTSARIEAGFHIPATAYIEALNLRAKILESFVSTVFDSGCDALYVPVLTGTVPSIASTTISTSGDAPAIIDYVTRCTRWVSYLGLPAAAFPCGFAGGLPVAAQLVGRPFAEGELLGIIDTYQRVTDWHRRRPPLSAEAASA